MKIKPLKFKFEIPPYKTRSEREMEELIHRQNVIARRRQVEDYKFSQEVKYLL